MLISCLLWGFCTIGGQSRHAFRKADAWAAWFANAFGVVLKAFLAFVNAVSFSP